MGVEFTDEQLCGKVVAGVDTHSETHWLCVLDERGRVALSREFPATAEGYGQLADAIGDPDGCAAVGVEGTASYGAGLTDVLVARHYNVLEVLRPKRDKRMSGDGKNDEMDAERAARDVVAGKAVVPKSRGGWVEDLRALANARGILVDCATRMKAQATSMLVTAPDTDRRRWEGVSKGKLMTELLALKGKDGPSALELTLASLASAWAECRERADELESEMRALIEEGCPAILCIGGCGTVTAATLIVSAGGNPSRFGSEAKFAKHCGTSPIPASTGKTKKMRLNPGGDRKANKALTQIVVSRLANDEDAKAYVERRTKSDEKSELDCIRCLKRYVAREVYRALTHPFDVTDRLAEGRGLAEARRSQGLTQRQAAAASGISATTVCAIERGRVGVRSRSYRLYMKWVEDGMPVDDEVAADNERRLEDDAANAMGKELREERLLAGKTLRDVAEAIGFSDSSVLRAETGKLGRNSKALRAYARWVESGMPHNVENSA